MQQCNGTIFQIQRWSINDGGGIRSTVFLKGCPLRCKWCANPESWSGRPEVLYFREQCSGCGRCTSICDFGANKMQGQSGVAFIRERCNGCYKCCEVCPTGARKKMGLTVTVEDVLRVIKRDAIFYRASEGGVTFSGGEPFAQPEFLRQLVSACNQRGIDTAVETSGYFSWEQVKDIFERLDFVFIDIKHMDEELHKKWTGVSNRRILENIRRISQMRPTVVRVPLIEEVNATEENIKEMCEFLRQNTQVEGVELLPYHDFGEAKYSAVGAGCPKFRQPDEAKIEKLKTIITDYQLCVVDFK